jgi:hypothetical protein
MPETRPTMLVESEDDPVIHQAIFDTIENQIRDHTPPETALTFERLLAAGETRDTALRYIACALSVEFFEIIQHSTPFDEARYVRNLQALPALPYDENEI